MRARSTAEILKALDIAAQLVELYGDRYAPYFEAVEAIYADAQKRQATVERALAMRAKVRAHGLHPSVIIGPETLQ